MNNLKVYSICLVILMSSVITGCKDGSFEALDSYKDVKFYARHGFSLSKFLEENNLVLISSLNYQDIKPYYEAKVIEVLKDEEDLNFVEKWRKIDDFDSYMGVSRLVKPKFKVYKIDYNDGNPKLIDKVTDDLYSLPEGFDYVKEDEIIVNSYSEDVLLNKGKVIERK